MLRIARQHFSCALVGGRGVVFRHYSPSMAKTAGKDFVMVPLCHSNTIQRKTYAYVLWGFCLLSTV
jgi:hypothetical protein